MSNIKYIVVWKSAIYRKSYDCVAVMEDHGYACKFYVQMENNGTPVKPPKEAYGDVNAQDELDSANQY